MTKKYTVFVLVSLTMLVTATAILVSKKNKVTGSNNMLPVSLRTLHMNDGWGYEILVDNKVYIHQDYIPAISSYKRFTTEADALLVGNRVLDKIKHGRKPTLTPKEIDDTHIHYR